MDRSACDQVGSEGLEGLTLRSSQEQIRYP